MLLDQEREILFGSQGPLCEAALCEVECDIASTVGTIFHAVLAFINLGELAYFGLAYMKDKCLQSRAQLAWCHR